MVTPVVLLTVGTLISNGLLIVYSAINDRMREMTHERIAILTGPAGEMLELASVPGMGRERLSEIRKQLPMLLRRHRLTRTALLTIYVSIGVLGLSIIAIAIAVTVHNDVIAHVALGLVLAGTVIMLGGLTIAGLSLAKSADAVTYAVEQTLSLGQLDASARPGAVSGGEFDQRDDPARHETGRPYGRAGARHFGHLDHPAPGLDLDPPARTRRADLVRLGAVADVDNDLDPITFHFSHPTNRTSIRYPFWTERNGICGG
jgi:hypothetical protein